MKKLSVIAFASIFTLEVVVAQRIDMQHVTAGIRSYGGYMFSNRVELETHGYSSLDLYAGLRTLPSDDDIYALSYGYPEYGIGTCVCLSSMIDVPGESYFGNYYSMYGYFNRPFIRKGRFTAAYGIEMGMAYNPVRYDPVYNPLNLYVSSVLMVHAALSFHSDWRIGDNMTAGLSVRAKHYSNGRTALPNLGLNMLEAGVSLRYAPSNSEARRSMKVDEPFDKRVNFHIAAAGGAHCTKSDWTRFNVREMAPGHKSTVFKAYPRFSIFADMLYRYSIKAASGISLEMFYSPDVDILERNDRYVYGDMEVDSAPTYSPVSAGVALAQEFYYRNFGLFFTLGAYLSEPAMGLSDDVSWNYQKAGLRYYIPSWNNLYIGLGMKANDFRESEYIELSIGVEIVVISRH